jgi:homoaconitase/3-isopropylmalate dehydratase large subunit
VIELTPEPERPRLLSLVPALYSRASDKKLAATVGEQALAGARADPKTSDAALAAIGRLRLAAGETAVATTNRNFRGRMGHVDSQVFLANAWVAAAAAVKGEICDPALLLLEPQR